MRAQDFRGTIRSFFRQDPTQIIYLPGLGGATALTDCSYGARHATARNTPAVGTGRFGGRAYALVNTDGTAAKYVDIPGSATVTWAAGTKLSVIFWVYFSKFVSETNEANFRFIEKGASSNGGAMGNLNIYWGGGGIGMGFSKGDNSATYAITGTMPVSPRSWHCIGLTYTFPTGSDATPPRMYVDGKACPFGSWNATPTGTNMTATGEALTIGCDQYSIAYYATDCRGLNGTLDEMGFWKGRIISPAEMAQYYNASRRRRPQFLFDSTLPAVGGSIFMPYYYTRLLAGGGASC